MERKREWGTGNLNGAFVGEGGEEGVGFVGEVVFVGVGGGAPVEEGVEEAVPGHEGVVGGRERRSGGGRERWGDGARIGGRGLVRWVCSGVERGGRARARVRSKRRGGFVEEEEAGEEGGIGVGLEGVPFGGGHGPEDGGAGVGGEAVAVVGLFAGEAGAVVGGEEGGFVGGSGGGETGAQEGGRVPGIEAEGGEGVVGLGEEAAHDSPAGDVGEEIREAGLVAGERVEVAALAHGERVEGEGKGVGALRGAFGDGEEVQIGAEEAAFVVVEDDGALADGGGGDAEGGGGGEGEGNAGLIGEGGGEGAQRRGQKMKGKGWSGFGTGCFIKRNGRERESGVRDGSFRGDGSGGTGGRVHKIGFWHHVMTRGVRSKEKISEVDNTVFEGVGVATRELRKERKNVSKWR
jgi:hypothetical protein